jgi:mycothiol synthase
MSTTRTFTADLPSLKGVRFRSIRGEKEADALYAIHTGRTAHDMVNLSLHNEDFPSLDELHSDLLRAIAAGEKDRWLVAQIHNRVIGYSQLANWHEEDELWVYFIGGWVLPEWRGKGIGSAMLKWGEDKARQLAAMHHPNERFEFAANASSTEHNATTLLQNEGYHVGFTTLEMRFDISTKLPPTPSLPHGIEIRPLLAEHTPQIISSIIECYQNGFPVNRFRTTFDRVAYFSTKFQNPNFDPNLCYVAWDGNEIAGQVFLVIDNGEVYVDQVSIRPGWRRNGLARALLIRALRDMREQGEEKIWLDTYAEYLTRAKDLYRSLGFYDVKEFPRYRKTAGYDIDQKIPIALT